MARLAACGLAHTPVVTTVGAERNSTRCNANTAVNLLYNLPLRGYHFHWIYRHQNFVKHKLVNAMSPEKQKFDVGLS